MFTALFPLLAERSIHILLSANKDGKIRIHVQPAATGQKDEEACLTPITCAATPQELDENLPELLTKWVGNRAAVTLPLREALAAAEQALKANVSKATKKIEAQKPKQNGQAIKTPSKVPSLLDASSHASEGEGLPPVKPDAETVQAGAVTCTQPAAVATADQTPKTVSLFDD
jgi:PRTRC genetic system protein E